MPVFVLTYEVLITL